MKKLTTEEWIEKAKKVHEDKYDYSKVKYKKAISKVIIICPIHGKFEQTPHAHLQGQGCPICSKPVYDTLSFVEESIKKHGNTYDYSKVEYKKAISKVIIICPTHGEFEKTPNKHLGGQGCPICAIQKRIEKKSSNKKKFIEKAKRVHGDRYDYSKVEYKKAISKVIIICPIHGEFEQTPASHLSEVGCPKCGIEKSADASRKDLNTFIEQAKRVHGDRYDYSKVVYDNSKRNVIIICPVHGEFEQTPDSHLQGSACQKCGWDNIAQKLSSNKEEFIEKARLVHGNKFDYSKVVYGKNNSEKVVIICPIHGEFEQIPGNHLQGNGCPICANNIRLTTEEFIEQAKQVHSDKFDYSKVNYVNSNTKVCIVCPVHGEFKQTPDNHLQGQGCPICSESKLEKETAKLLQQYGIKHEREKRFDWLKQKKRLRLDFYLPDYNIAIECQGIQHFEPIRFGSITIEKANQNLKYLQNNDSIKKQLCEENNLPLYYISYDDNVEEKFNQIISKYKTKNNDKNGT